MKTYTLAEIKHVLDSCIRRTRKSREIVDMLSTVPGATASSTIIGSLDALKMTFDLIETGERELKDYNEEAD